jgi:hypothetical protein
MQYRLLAPVLFFTILMLNACMYTHVTMPLGTELNKTELGQKQGRSSMYSLLWLFAWGDAGAATAAKKGGITVLTHMDREFEAILFGIYTRTTTITYGD